MVVDHGPISDTSNNPVHSKKHDFWSSPKFYYVNPLIFGRLFNFKNLLHNSKEINMILNKKEINAANTFFPKRRAISNENMALKR